MTTRRPDCGRRGDCGILEAARPTSCGTGAVPFLRPAPRVWFFDMDDTLLASSAGILGEVHVLMNNFLMRRLGMSEAEANRVREIYWREYGSTFIGLWRRHGVDPRVFLPAVHDFDYRPYLKDVRGQRGVLERLSGRKVLLTNGPRSYVSKLLPALGLKGYFEAEVTSTDMRLFGDWRPKPSVSMLLALCARLGVRPHEAALVDDGLSNLKAARRAGLVTVWCVGMRRRHAGLRPPFGAPAAHPAVDVVVRDVGELARRFGRNKGFEK